MVGAEVAEGASECIVNVRRLLRVSRDCGLGAAALDLITESKSRSWMSAVLEAQMCTDYEDIALLQSTEFWGTGQP